ncbi:hypothetical protein CYMTET_49169 [Cymbomonas tetramitiformis]|uniref:Uncharacterized protein n=1 Tax=Cymbomonas tetramitiformis TaxID=36881 RepID=A0AAE0BSQ0_9CHLO|nr:hypothetical protein CYMTET_49169 [Cymbomonas tetramitiformis]
MAIQPSQHSSQFYSHNFSSNNDSVSSSKRGSECGFSLENDREYKRRNHERGASGTHISISSSTQDVSLQPTEGDTELHLESSEGQQEAIKCVVEGGAAVNATNQTQDVTQQTVKSHPILRAAAEEDLTAVLEMLKHPGVPVNTLDANGNTPLFWASLNRDTAMIEALLKAGADPSCATKAGWSVGHQVCLDDQEEAIPLVLKHLKPGDIDAGDDLGRTVLHRAAAQGRKARVELLLEHDADVEACDNYGNTPLHLAAENGHLEVVKVLVESAGKEVKERMMLMENETGLTPLAAAAAAGHYDVVVLLRKAGDVHDWSKLLSLAAKGQHDEVVEYFLTEAREAYNIDEVCQNALTEASRQGHADRVECLIRAKIVDTLYFHEIRDHWMDMDAALSEVYGMILRAAAEGGQYEMVFEYAGGSTEEAKERAFYEAGRHGHADVVGYFIEHEDIDVNVYVELGIDQGAHVLTMAAAEGKKAIVQVLLLHRANKFVQGDYGNTPLHLAAENGHLEVLKILVESAGEEVKERMMLMENEYGNTPLHLAAENGHLEVVKVLVESAGEEVKERMMLMENEDGDTPLVLAGHNLHEEVMVFLSGGSSRQRSKGQTQLHDMAAKGDMELLKQVYRNLGTVNCAPDQDGRTPLHYAAKEGKLDSVTFLLEKGADKEAKDKLGKRPLHVAAEGGIDNYRVIKELMKWGVDMDAKDNEGNKGLYYAPWVQFEMAKCS